MEKEPEELKKEIAELRTSLAGKLSVIEGQIRQDVTDAKDKVLTKLSLSRRIEKRPLLVVGGAFVSGFLVTRWAMGQGVYHVSEPTGASLSTTEPRDISLLEKAAAQFPEEAKVAKSILLSFAIGLTAKKAKEAMPKLADQIDQIERTLNAYVAQKQR